MFRTKPAAPRLLVLSLLAVGPLAVSAPNGYEVVTGKAFDSAMPKDFYLEGNAIPTEKRNAVLLKNGASARVLFALIDTSGYSSQIQQKYLGMLITEVHLSVCGMTLPVGSYGFGLKRPGDANNADAKLIFYNQAGGSVAECAAKRDDGLKQPRPLQVILTQGRSPRLYVGRYHIEFQ